MQELVSESKRDRLVRNLVGKIIQRCPNKDYYCYAKAIHEFCRDEIRYAYDPVGVEYVESARRILEAGVADCDSIVILFACLCEQIGLPCKFITIKTNPSNPDEFTHVYAAVKIPGQGWVASDPTMPQKPFGWQPDPTFPSKEWNASKDSPPEGFDEDMSGLGMMQSLGVRSHLRRQRRQRMQNRQACVLGGGKWNKQTSSCSGMRGLSGIPGVQDSPAVIVEKPYEFREEPAFITVTPEELELDSIGDQTSGGLPTGEPREFWSRDQVEGMIREQGAAPKVTVKMKAGPALSGLAAEADDERRKTVLWVTLGLAGIAMLFASRPK